MFDDRTELIKYIDQKIKFLVDGKYMSDIKTKKIKEYYLSSDMDISEIKKEIDEKITRLVEQKKSTPSVNSSIEELVNLDVPKKGITLNIQVLDLIKIVSANDSKTLMQVIDSITIFSKEEKDNFKEEFKSDLNLDKLKHECFDLYKDHLDSTIDHLTSSNPSVDVLARRLDFAIENCDLSSDRKSELRNLIDSYTKDDENNPKNYVNALEEVEKKFSREEVNSIFRVLGSYFIIERTGIKDTSYDAFERLSRQLDNYNLVVVDVLAKYSHYVRQDGTFNREDLKKMLDFAKERNMQTRLNALMFYMDFPREYENLPVTHENKILVKNKLSNYVMDITTFIREYNEEAIREGYKPTVDTVEVLNELLNRFYDENFSGYSYRGDIDKDGSRIDGRNPNYDNLRAGWLRFLTIDDLCDIMRAGKNNMPGVKCMINECNLEDARKHEPFREIFSEICSRDSSLIDSIGTQMHIDDSITKDNLDSMFGFLKKFGLPIEVTEYDLALSDIIINEHSEDEIKNFKMRKFSELIMSINEANMDFGKIDGLSIWSISDYLNSNVTKRNRTRYFHDEELIKSVYGGFYDSDMIDRGKHFNRNFNYHTHTYRSGHGEYVSDEEMVLAARDIGISKLGFSEHIPNSRFENPCEDNRMLLSEVDKYIESIDKLKEKYGDMTILKGFEAEFDPSKIEHLVSMREKVDYMILGQHFVSRDGKNISASGNPNYPIEYARRIVSGIESGLFDIVAHPDIFMQYSDGIKDDDRDIFHRNCIIASQMICNAACKMNIPLEINLSKTDLKLNDQEFSYPHSLFWEIARETSGLHVIEGIDAHYRDNFSTAGISQIKVDRISSMVEDKLLGNDYDPTIAREKNTLLQEAYDRTKHSITREDIILTDQLFDKLSRNDDPSKPSDIVLRENMARIESSIQINYENEINRVNSSIGSAMGREETISKLRRKRDALLSIEQSNMQVKKLFNLAKSAIEESIDRKHGSLNEICENARNRVHEKLSDTGSRELDSMFDDLHQQKNSRQKTNDEHLQKVKTNSSVDRGFTSNIFLLISIYVLLFLLYAFILLK